MEEPIYYYEGTDFFARESSICNEENELFCQGLLANVMKGIHFLRGNLKAIHQNGVKCWPQVVLKADNAIHREK